MGNSVSPKCVYSREIEPSKADNETGVYGAILPETVPETALKRPFTNAFDVFLNGKTINPNGHCLGSRKRLPNGNLGDYAWLSYTDVERLARSCGTFLAELIEPQEFPSEVYLGARRIKMLGIFSKNCVPWFVCEQAANAYNIALVPFYDSLQPEVIRYIFEQTGLKVVAGSLTALQTFLKIPAVAAQMQHFIVFDPEIPEGAAQLASENSVNLLLYSEILQTPAKPLCPGNRDAISTLCYTSGTTGEAKAVILTHGNILATIEACLAGPLNEVFNNFRLSPQDIHFSYLPAAHVFERAIVNLVYFLGASVGVFSGNIPRLLEDVQLLKPTLFISVPRLFNRIHDKIFASVKEKSALAQRLFNAGLQAKLRQYRADGSLQNKFYNNLVFNRIRDTMGGETRYMVVGGAPILKSVQENISVLFSTPLVQGYGLTESMGTTFIGHSEDPVSGHVGGPIPGVEFKLVSVEELQYSVDQECPSGELLLRGPMVSPGYFSNPSATQASFDEDGWFRTGDIVSLLPNGALKIVDRKKNIFKLSQGEYVAPDAIEIAYLQSKYIAQIFVYGESQRNNLVAIAVLDPEAAAAWQRDHPEHQGDTLKALCSNEAYISVVKADLQNVTKNILKGFQRVEHFHFTDEEFTEENGLLTPTFKLKRHVAKQRFASVIASLYGSG